MSINPVRYFSTIFLEEVEVFFKTLDNRAVRKILYNIDLAEQTNDPRLFKKLNNDIWSLEPNTAIFNIACWHFGIRQTSAAHWW